MTDKTNSGSPVTGENVEVVVPTTKTQAEIDATQDATIEQHSKDIKDTIRKQNDLRTSIDATKDDIKDLRSDISTSCDTLRKHGDKISSLEDKVTHVDEACETVRGMKKEFRKVDEALETTKRHSTRLADQESRVTETEKDIRSVQYQMKGNKEAIDGNFAADEKRAEVQAAKDDLQNAQLESLHESDAANRITDEEQYTQIRNLQKRVETLEKTCKKSAILKRCLLTVAVAIVGAVIILSL